MFTRSVFASVAFGFAFAALVVLAKGPRKVDPDAIKDIKVLGTWMDGKQVFTA